MRLSCVLKVESPAQVKEQLALLEDRPGHLVLDLRGAELDSAALGTVLWLHRQLELKDRRLAIVATDPQFLSLIERTGVHRTLSVFDDTEQAVRFLFDQALAGTAV